MRKRRKKNLFGDPIPLFGRPSKKQEYELGATRRALKGQTDAEHRLGKKPLSKKKNIYFDRKSLGFKLGKKPLSKAQKSKQRAIARQEKAHAKLAQRAERAQAKREAGTLFRQLRSQGKKESAGKKKAEQRASMSARDKELWEELLRQNPAKAHRLMRSTMPKKRKKRKKKNPRKGVMPTGLRKWWAKRRRAKNARRRKCNPKRRKRVVRRRRRVTPRVRSYRRNPRKRRATVRRRRRPNPRRGQVHLHMPPGIAPGSKAERAFVRLAAKAYRAPARIVKR